MLFSLRCAGCPVWLYCCVVLRSLWHSRPLLVLKWNHSFITWCPEWDRLLLFPALVSDGSQTLLSLSSSEKWISSFHHSFCFYVFQPFHLFCHSKFYSTTTCCSLYLVFLCKRVKFLSNKKRSWNQTDFEKRKKNAQKESHQQRVCERRQTDTPMGENHKDLYLFCICIINWDVFNYFECWNKAC